MHSQQKGLSCLTHCKKMYSEKQNTGSIQKTNNTVDQKGGKESEEVHLPCYPIGEPQQII